MALVEAAIRDQVNHDLDCTEAACRLMAMRSEVADLVGRWKAAGGTQWLPSIGEHLKKSDRPAKPNRVGRSVTGRP